MMWMTSSYIREKNGHDSEWFSNWPKSSILGVFL